MVLVTRYMDSKKINDNLQIKIKKHLRHRFESDYYISPEIEESILNQLSPQMKE
jgi:hypothetical protein